MNDLGPLLLLWAMSKCSPAAAARPGQPLWPSAASPPPPLPPLPGLVPPMPSADTGTPLPDVPAAAAPPPSGAAPPSDVPAPEATVPAALKEFVKSRDKLYSAARDAVLKPKKKPAAKKKAVQKYLGLPLMPGATFVSPKAGPPAPPQMNVSVADLQTALLKRGVDIRKDGLYGPKTESAWMKLASARRLSPIMYRVTSKIARVARDTYLTLSGPAVP